MRQFGAPSVGNPTSFKTPTDLRVLLCFPWEVPTANQRIETHVWLGIDPVIDFELRDLGLPQLPLGPGLVL